MHNGEPADDGQQNNQGYATRLFNFVSEQAWRAISFFGNYRDEDGRLRTEGQDIRTAELPVEDEGTGVAAQERPTKS